MDNTIKIYKAKKYYNIGLLIIPLLLVIPLLEGGGFDSRKLLGYSIFAFVGGLLVALPLAMKLEVKQNTVKSYLFGFQVREIRASEVQSINYTNLFHGGLGFGKGLVVQVKKKGVNTRMSIGEKLFGKQAIEDVRQALKK